ncbi:MAG: hypothetical protein ABJQ14_00375, partial [Hyphomicrobiales bacterium]
CESHQDAHFEFSPAVLTASQYDASDIVLVGRVSTLKPVAGDFGQEFLVAEVAVIAFIKGEGNAIVQVVVDTNMPHFNFGCCLKDRVYIMYLNENANLGYLVPFNEKDLLLVYK